MESKAHTEGVTRHNEDGLVEEFDKEAQGHHGQHGHHDHHEHRITTTHGIVEAAALFRGDETGHLSNKLLLPRPTEDPRDPLTWSSWRKHTAFGTICFFVFMSNYTTSSINPILLAVITNFDISLTQATYLITLNILTLGLGNLFWIPLGLKIGKRPVLLLSSAIFFASSIWAAEAKTYGSLLGARIIQGFGASSSEAMGPAVVADLYFLHQRGAMIGFYTFMIAVGSALGGVFGGYVANANPNWRWVFHMDTILTGVVFLATIIFQAETNFVRPQEYETGEGMQRSELQAIRAQGKVNWTKSLGITAWYDKGISIWWLWWRPFLTLQYPAVVWGSLTYGVTLGWIVLQQTANASALPALYGYNANNIGNAYWTYVIGAFCGCVAGGPMSDYVVAMISRRREGYFKPEFRLWALIPAFIFGPIGLLMWGFGFGHELDPLVAIAGSGISYGVLCAVPAVGMSYVVDCHRPVSGETMTVLTAFKNTFAFALSFAVTPWLARDGYAKVGGWNTLIEGLVFATTIPMYIYGERIRRWSVKLTI